MKSLIVLTAVVVAAATLTTAASQPGAAAAPSHFGTTGTTTPTPAPPAKPSQQWRVPKLRHSIAKIRATTVRLRAEVGLSHIPASHLAQHTRSVPLLLWIKHRWHKRLSYISRIVRGGPREYAHILTLRKWHSEAAWVALNEIVMAESSWNPCASFPGNHDCSYAGSNACGIPQRYYCPTAWRGNLWATRWAQARDLIAYVAGRYGDPFRAHYYRFTLGSY